MADTSIGTKDRALLEQHEADAPMAIPMNDEREFLGVVIGG